MRQPNESSTKYIEVTQREAAEFIAELNKVRRSRASGRKAKPSSSQQTKSTASSSKKRMSPRSAKAKGRKLQQWVVEQLLNVFKGLTNLDVRSTPMGVNGVDVQLSTAAFTRFSYDIECKNTERMTTCI